MSARRRWLVAYDIRDEVRWRKVYDSVRSHGERLQYSVFLCDLTAIEKFNFMSDLRQVLDLRRDSVAFIDLGEVGGLHRAKIEFMGTSFPLPPAGPTIV